MVSPTFVSDKDLIPVIMNPISPELNSSISFVLDGYGFSISNGKIKLHAHLENILYELVCCSFSCHLKHYPGFCEI